MANGLLGQRAEEAYASPEELDSKRGMRMVGAALMESGLSQLGAPIVGKAISQYLRDDWHRQEAQTFTATVGKDINGRIEQAQGLYKNRTKLTQELPTDGPTQPEELRRGYYSEYGPDGAAVPTSFITADDFMAVNQHINAAASDLIGNVNSLSMEYMDAAAQYPNNPLIESKAKNMVDHISKQFEGQLTASRMAGEQMDQREKAMALEKQAEDREIERTTLPARRAIALAKGPQELDTIAKANATTRAQIDRGREIAAANGKPLDQMDEQDFLQEYAGYQLAVEEAADWAQIEKNRDNGLLPPGVNPENLPSFLLNDPRGNGILQGFVREQRRQFARQPGIKVELEAAAQEAQKRVSPSSPVVPYDKLPDESDLENGIVGKDYIQQRVFIDNPNIYDAVRKKAMTEATKYFLGRPEIGGPLGVRPIPSGILADQPVTIFKNEDEALRIVKPELFTEESEDKYADKIADEEHSGDPDDPFGLANEDPSSPVSDGAARRESDKVEAWTTWYGRFAADDAIPLTDKKKQARRAVHDIDLALRNLATRQSLDEWGIPTDDYRIEIQRLMTLRANFIRLSAAKAGEDVPNTLASDVGAVYDKLEDYVTKMGEFQAYVVTKESEELAESVEYLTGKPVTDKGKKAIKGIFETVVNPIDTQAGLLVKGAQAATQIPFWSAPPEEQERRRAAWEAFNRNPLEASGM